MHWHWQDLNEARRYWRHGRAWLYFGREREAYPSQKTIGVEWAIGAWAGWSLMFTHSAEERDYQLNVSIGFMALYINLSGFRAYNAMQRTVFGKQTGFYYFEDYFALKWNCDDSSWSSTTGPAHGKAWGFIPSNFFLGRAVYNSEVLDQIRCQLSMPENRYPCTVNLTLDTWKRPRWPWPKRIRRATIVMDTPVPTPGKGENSWDCDEDATYESTLPAATAGEALTKLRASIMARREKYGGKNWIPAKYR